jgi:hypothetical protein
VSDSSQTTEAPHYGVRECRGHWHVTGGDEDLWIPGDPFSNEATARDCADLLNAGGSLDDPPLHTICRTPIESIPSGVVPREDGCDSPSCATDEHPNRLCKRCVELWKARERLSVRARQVQTLRADVRRLQRAIVDRNATIAKLVRRDHVELPICHHGHVGDCYLCAAEANPDSASYVRVDGPLTGTATVSIAGAMLECDACHTMVIAGEIQMGELCRCNLGAYRLVPQYVRLDPPPSSALSEGNDPGR